MTKEHPWSIPVRVENVPEDGRDFACSADETTRAAIARAAGVQGLPRLEMSIHAARHGRGGLHLAGTVSATVRQSCVVTLEPLVNEVIETIDLVFAPATAAEPAGGAGNPHDPGEPELPEPLVDGAVDLGEIAVEHLLLGIDPYPRRPGAVFSGSTTGGDGDNPFAALAALMKRGREER
jgi:hypothetical protein